MIRKITILLGVLFLTGCAVPGTYLNPGTVRTPPVVNNHWLNPRIVPIDSDLLRESGESQHHSVFKAPPEYKIGSYDVLDIIVWGHPELTIAGDQNTLATDTTMVVSQSPSPILAHPQTASGFYVDSEGYVYFPYIGKVKASGLTVDQLRVSIAQALSTYIRKPQVSVRVTVFRSRQVFMIGEFNNQGILPLTDKPMSLFDSINRAGGIALNTADASHIYVIRGGFTHSTVNVYWLNAKTPEAMLLAEHFYLKPDDVVYVTPAGVSSWNRVVSQIMPTIQTIWYTKATVNN